MRSPVYFLAAILISACAHLAFVGLFFIPEPKPGSKKNTVYVELGSSFENLVKGPPLTISKSDFGIGSIITVFADMESIDDF